MTRAAPWDAEILRLIKARENSVFEIRLPDGARAALRLHRPCYQNDASIRSELWWMTALADSGLPVPRPVPAHGGAMLTEIDGRRASVVTWIDGEEIGAADRPLGPDTAGTWRALGELVARMHDATDALKLPDWFERPRWDAPALIGEQPNWGRFWENPALSDDESALLARARETAGARLDKLTEEGADTGLIHADLLRENVMRTARGLAIIDFDDCGMGFRAYDLATAEVQGMEDPMNPSASLSLWEGYTETRRAGAPPLGDVTLFVALRAFASCGWIMSRAEAGDPRLRFYAKRALRAADGLLGAV